MGKQQVYQYYDVTFSYKDLPKLTYKCKSYTGKSYTGFVEKPILGLFSKIKEERTKDYNILKNIINDRGVLNSVLEAVEKNALEAVEKNALELKNASGNLKINKFAVLAAVTNNGLALEYAYGYLPDDKEVVLAAVQNNGYAL